MANGPLLTDSTMPFNFCKAGYPAAQAMVDYFGDRLHMVGDVHTELERLSAGFVALQRFVGAWPKERTRKVDSQLTLKVAAAIKVRQVAGQHAKEDLGETATVLYAEQRRDAGEEFEVVTDDRYGKTLARDRGFSPVTTPAIVIEMVCAKALSYQDGHRVWRQCFSDKTRWTQFKARIEQTCPDVLDT